MASCCTGVAAGLGFGMTKEVFAYNRKNFMYDRDLRRKMELTLMEFRIKQAEQWREDVKDLVSLTEKKMHIYLLSLVLLCLIIIMLWMEGRLYVSRELPEWVMTGYVLSMGGAFMFLLLSIWLGIYSAVSAQSFEARLRTQFVRLPIPSWNEVEACRTYGSQFENTEPRQMFRIPFLMGQQESLVKTASEVRESMGDVQAQSDRPRFADPWGLEKPNDAEELGCALQEQVADQRHIKIARQVAVQWQTYDAYARVSLTIGVNQMLLALTYFLLGYLLGDDRCREAASYGVILLMLMTECIFVLDMQIRGLLLRCIQALIAAGPVMSLLAMHAWMRGDLGRLAAHFIVPKAFFLHSCYLAAMLYLSRGEIQPNGTRMPIYFRQLLYLDVFSWAKPVLPDPDQAEAAKAQMALPHYSVPQELLIGDPWQGCEDILREDLMSWFMASMGAHACTPELIDEILSSVGVDHVVEARTRGNSQCAHDDVQAPAMAACRYDGGLPVPTCPQELQPPGYINELHCADGVPREGQCGAEVEAKDTPFHTLVDFLNYDPARWTTELELDGPAALPYKVFRSFMIVLAGVWLLASIIFAAKAATFAQGAWILGHSSISSPNKGHDSSFIELRSNDKSRSGLERHNAVPPTKLVSLWAASILGQWAIAERLQVIPTKWPHANFKPGSLSCDAAGRHLLVSNKLLAFTADLHDVRVIGQYGRQKRHLQQREEAPLPFFQELHCPLLTGEALQDTAVSCGEQVHWSGSECMALMLHRRGQRVGACVFRDLRHARGEQFQPSLPRNGLVVNISDAWQEMPTSIAIDHECAAADAAAAQSFCSPLLGTMSGGVVQMKQSMHAGLVPAEVVRESREFEESSSSKIVRVFNSQYAGMLDSERQSIILIDRSKGGVEAGRLLLPSSQHATSFCAGGGHIYMLIGGTRPQLTRMKLPSSLSPDLLM